MCGKIKNIKAIESISRDEEDKTLKNIGIDVNGLKGKGNINKKIKDLK